LRSEDNPMSAKITVIVYILICFEVGILLLILPWRPEYWEENFFLYYVTGKFNSTWIPAILTSGYVKGVVTGIGVLNILAGLRDLFKFRESVAALLSLGNGEPDKESVVETISIEAIPADLGSIESGSTQSDSTQSGSTQPGSSQPLALSAEHGATQPAALSDHRPTGIPPQS
jgi:hypothetical protein